MRRASHAGLVFTGHRRIVHRTILLRVAWRSLHRVDVGLRVLDRLIVWFSRLRTWNVYGFFWHEDGTDGTAIGSKEKPRATDTEEQCPQLRQSIAMRSLLRVNIMPAASFLPLACRAQWMGIYSCPASWTVRATF